MRPYIKLIAFIGWSAFFIDSNGQSEEASARVVIEQHRAKQQKEMKSETSPLVAKDKRRFKGLNYFPVDLNYRVTARFVKTETPELFKMRTTTTRLPEYRKYGEVYFTLNDHDYKLEVYQSPDVTKRDGYEDYLFIPFTDKTNGEETYEVGRYLEMRIPESDEVIVDFNLCYNPYCSYNPNYSCPIPPAVNDLPIEVRAGEKKFKQKH